MKLYEIANEYKNFLEAVENGEIADEAIADTLESIQLVLEDKADNIACLIKNMTAEAEAIKVEETRLAERRKQKEKQIESIKSYLQRTLLESGVNKVETARNKISFRKSEVLTVDNETEFIEWAIRNNDEYLTYKDPTINKVAVKKAIASGVEVVGARLETKQNLQIK